MKKHTHEYITRKRIRVGIWGFHTEFANRKCMQEMVDLGVDTIFHGNATTNPATRETTLRLADEMGVEVYVQDYFFNIGDSGKGEKWDDDRIEKWDPKNLVSNYIHHPSFAGNYVVDEHGTRDFEWIAKIANKYQKETGRTAYINLLPKYAKDSQLKFGAAVEDIKYFESDSDFFQTYNDEYCRLYDTFYISTDIYPLDWSGGNKKATYKDYVESINQVARSARNFGKEFWCCIQTYAWHAGKRTPDEAEFRWQCYCMLSFGCTCITLYQYSGSRDYPALVHPVTTMPTDAYYACQTVMWEMRNLSDLYVQYKNLGAFTVNCTEKTPYLRMTQEYTDFDAIRDIKCDDPLLVGCFEKEKGRGKAFTVTNMVDWREPKDVTLTFKTKAKKVTAYYKAEPVVLKANRGVYTINLEQGEGVFVTLD